MSLTLAAEVPPLTIHDDGSIRVTGTRFLLDVLIASHVNWGWSAEKIAAEYDTLRLADVYAVLAYYSGVRVVDHPRDLFIRHLELGQRVEEADQRAVRPADRNPVGGLG